MGEFAAELRRCLESNASDADRTLIVQSPVLRESRPHRVRAKRRRWPLYALVLLIAAAAIVAGVLGLSGGKKNGGRPAAGGGSSSGAVALSATGNYDPQGSDTHGDTAPNATDGNAGTFWYTQTYATPDFGGLMPGLGLVLKAGRPVKLASLTVTTSTPGFTAQVLAGDSLGAQPPPDSAPQTVTGSTTFTLHGATARYYVLWITRLPPGGVARVNEVTAHS
jgi:hypothetical protein